MGKTFDKMMDAVFGPVPAAPAETPLATRDDLGGEDIPTGSGPAQIAPPSRLNSSKVVSQSDALGISMVYRAISIHAIAGKQMSIGLWRENLSTGKLERLTASSFIRKPDPDMPRSAFVELTITSLACSGNAYWRIFRDGSRRVTGVRVLDPQKVTPNVTPSGRAVDYSVAGMDKALPADEVKHLKLLRIPGAALGLGPIQAAQVELRGAMDLNSYAGNFFSDGDIPTGVLKSEQVLNKEQTTAAKTAFKDSQGGKRDVVVLGQGLDYKPIFLSPDDAQFLQNKQYTTTEIARMFGTPSSLMLANVEGSSQTYQNIEQDWLGFVRFSNMQYLIEIEDALSDLLPRGQEAKFNVEALLRSDTTTRYTAYKSGIEAGWLLKSEVRETENLPAVAGIDKKPEPPIVQAPATTEKETE